MCWSSMYGRHNAHVYPAHICICFTMALRLCMIYNINIIGSNTNQREYSSFIDVRDLEWARGHGFRFERKKKTKESAKS